MAMVQIQGFITPVYEPILEIFGNGEVITEAGQINLAVGLGNRIEFVKSRVPDASDTPERIYTLRDDFFSLHHSSVVPGYLDTGAMEYVSNFVGNPVLSTSSVSGKNPGNLNVFMPGDSATNEFYFYLGDDAHKLFNCTNLVGPATFVVAVTLAGGAATQFNWGFAQDGNALNGGSNSLSLAYQAFEANWQIFYRKSGVSTTLDTAVPVVVGEYVVCRFILTATGDIDIEIDGVVTNTILSADKPLGDMTVGGRFATTVADAAPDIATTDFFFVSAGSGVRSGP